ncbi:hypothetical protein [Frigoriglobus tundricola]|uniref:Uncharacterized protein n=1 Tax=Frigoriglobus tundricola TaxID=2774151 RepID=A0A6M5YQ19_9BACT|nr:hypothetical protein [Frigoriglobus tundricola]QJW95604.1 hypothetical protein FTUN_3154 [Frigoriglobus tundricola]
MVTPMLRELTGPFPPFFHFEGPWFLHERSARHLIDAWDHVCQRAIQEGNAEDLHAARDDYQAVLLAHLKILDGYLLLLDRFAGEYPTEFVDRLIPGRDRLQKHYDALFPRWQTIDDLEAMLLERISLPNDRLKALAEKYPPPQAWYDEAHGTSAAQE